MNILARAYKSRFAIAGGSIFGALLAFGLYKSVLCYVAVGASAHGEKTCVELGKEYHKNLLMWVALKNPRDATVLTSCEYLNPTHVTLSTAESEKFVTILSEFASTWNNCKTQWDNSAHNTFVAGLADGTLEPVLEWKNGDQTPRGGREDAYQSVIDRFENDRFRRFVLPSEQFPEVASYRVILDAMEEQLHDNTLQFFSEITVRSTNSNSSPLLPSTR